MTREIGFYLDDPHTAPGLRWQWADAVKGARIGHTGWFCDKFCDDTIRGVVFRLPRSRGFLPGASMGEHMSTTLGCEIIADEADAARLADEYARVWAEAERDYREAEAEREREEEEARAREEHATLARWAEDYPD
jgi:hypothetical protein